MPAEAVEEPSASHFRFCAETAVLRSHWAIVLKRGKCAALGVELHGAPASMVVSATLASHSHSRSRLPAALRTQDEPRRTQFEAAARPSGRESHS